MAVSVCFQVRSRPASEALSGFVGLIRGLDGAPEEALRRRTRGHVARWLESQVSPDLEMVRVFGE